MTGNKERGEKVSILVMRIQVVRARTENCSCPQGKGVQRSGERESSLENLMRARCPGIVAGDCR